jgi:UDPglucose 6-dehydrogenase
MRKKKITKAESWKIFTITQIGGGFVGHAAYRGLTFYGHHVTIVEISAPQILKLGKEGITACFSGEECSTNRDFYFISVPTPLLDDKIDLRFLFSAVASLGLVIKDCTNWPIVVIRSTVPPGTTDDLVAILEQYSGKKVGEDFGICMNPEFLREKTADYDFLHPWAIVVGSNDHRVAKAMEDLYAPFGVRVDHLLIREAEMLKYLHNIVNAIIISLFNEMRRVIKAAGLDPVRIFRVLLRTAEAFWNSNYGVRDLGGFGGSCLPKDTTAFKTWVYEKLGLVMRILDAAIEINEAEKRRRYRGE